jgi:Galactosyltransferase
MSIYSVQLNDSFDLCVIMVIFSHSFEHRLRNWHRSNFRDFMRQYKLSNMHELACLKMYFSLAYDSKERNGTLLLKENATYSDLLLVEHQENYRFLSYYSLQSMRYCQEIFYQLECRVRFYVKADSDTYIDFSSLLKSIEIMPSESVFFGLLMTNYPTTSIQDRYYHHSFSRLPPWAVGGLYGMSYDVMEVLTSPHVSRHVVKINEKYYYPEEDRGIGIALFRSSTKIQHLLFLKGLYFFCPAN